MVYYSFEMCPTNRGLCKTCETSFEKGDPRFGRGSSHWKCLDCISTEDVMNAEAVHGSVEKIPGINAFSEKQVDHILATLKKKTKK
ncbi:hypothetical protein HDU98_010077 [Podochytrium sp. JEL0797]|nr:hypothetical protein HDU98_010077 [Podochytrium sp. JEL0797]